MSNGANSQNELVSSSDDTAAGGSSSSPLPTPAPAPEVVDCGAGKKKCEPVILPAPAYKSRTGHVYELPAGFWIKGTREVSFMHLIGVYLAILFHLLPPAPPVVVEHSPRPCHTAVGAAVLFRRLKVASAATRSSSCPVNRAGRPERISFGAINGMAWTRTG